MAPAQPESNHNFDVDYVISYCFTETDQAKAEAGFQRLVHTLAGKGFTTEVRAGEGNSILLFLKVASNEYLYTEVYRSRVKDWLYGVRQEAPDQESKRSLSSEPLTEAERLRIIYQMITNPQSDGGAGITPKQGEWAAVQSVFPLHDHQHNGEWIKAWSMKYYLTMADLDQIRNRLGEKVAFYFAFLQSYVVFQSIPAALGILAYFFLGSFSPIYAVLHGLWCVVFVEYWKFQETDLAVRWGVRGVSSIQIPRREFHPEREQTDPVTGETVLVYPARKRFAWQLLQIPFAIIASLVLGSLIAACFAIEIFISEFYDGPGKSLLNFLPTGILTVFVPLLTGVLTKFATRLNDLENYQNTDEYEAALTQKLFVLNFITSYLPILLTAFVYIPFGDVIVPYLDVFNVTAQRTSEKGVTAFTVNRSRLKQQVIYSAITAQIVNLVFEVVVPYVTREGFRKAKELQSKRAGGTDVAKDDTAEEAPFLDRVRKEAELEEYDVTVDLREMCIQYGHLSLFAVVWPLTALAFIVNNWVELRSDAIKICVEMQRPIPWRADSIGPWLDSLGFLTWLGSLTTAALVHLYSGDSLTREDGSLNMSMGGLLLSIFFSEHIYLVVGGMVRGVLSKVDSPGLQKERGERFMVRKRYLVDTLGEVDAGRASSGNTAEKINRATLEEDARQSSLRDSRPEDRFWLRQKYWQETATIGTDIIRTVTSSEGKKTQ
ncbi:MAG: hypothetical protein M1838_003373 [Thelocarpon superellum]|nr:MAG: hypothetical protein M1838_003373 [Thelocarpon superellum]